MDLSLEQKDWCALEGLYDSNNNISENVTSTSEVSIMENLSGENKGDSVAHADSSSINPDPLASLSLEEKVTNFIQNGDLDPVEDGDDSQESKVNLESEPVADMPLGTCPPSDNNAMALNGSSLTSNHPVPSGTLGQLLRDDHMRHIDQTTNFNTDLDAEMPETPSGMSSSSTQHKNKRKRDTKGLSSEIVEVIADSIKDIKSAFELHSTHVSDLVTCFKIEKQGVDKRIKLMAMLRDVDDLSVDERMKAAIIISRDSSLTDVFFSLIPEDVLVFMKTVLNNYS